MNDTKTLDKKKVAAVCGNEMIVFGPQESGQGRRERLQTVTFNNYGQALAAGVQFDLDERLKEERKQKLRGQQ